MLAKIDRFKSHKLWLIEFKPKIVNQNLIFKQLYAFDRQLRKWLPGFVAASMHWIRIFLILWKEHDKIESFESYTSRFATLKCLLVSHDLAFEAY